MSRLPAVTDDAGNLPCRTVPAGSDWHRITGLAHASPLYFARAAGSRFNPASATFGTLYLAETLTGALAESLCRNAALKARTHRFTPLADLGARGDFLVTIRPALRLLDLTVPNLVRYGLTADLYAEYDGRLARPYRWGPAWADHVHGLGLDGICYPSRHHTACICLALFERPFADCEWQLVARLDRHFEALRLLSDEFDWAIV